MGWTALGFLVVASTLIGYAAFLWLNRKVSSTLANTFSYVAPLIALGLSTLLLGETLTWPKIAASMLSLIGVALMSVGSLHPRQTNPTHPLPNSASAR